MEVADHVQTILHYWRRIVALAVPIDADSASLIAGWDPDATWWFRPEVLDVRDEASIAWHCAAGMEWRRR